jgi:hypothetical protein
VKAEFSGKIVVRRTMIPKSGSRFSGKDHGQTRTQSLPPDSAGMDQL